MANQLALKLYCRPGDDVIVGVESHAAWHETGAAAAVGGVQLTAIGSDGRFTADEFLAARKPRGHPLYPPTTLVEVEDTQNRKGGLVWDRAELERIGAAAREHEVASYLDGARLLNAAVARGDDPAALAAPFDLVSIALSKGLGCPVGSVLAGGREDIAALVRYRRMLGGAMRQSGVLAAAGVHALEHHVERLAEDHANARLIGERLHDCAGVELDIDALETNIVVFGLRAGAPDAAARGRARGRARGARDGVRAAHGPRGHAPRRLARRLRARGRRARGSGRLSDAIYFSSPAEFGAWLEQHHETEKELWLGYWKKATGKPSLTWSQAVDEALCFGWIDGVMRGIDDERHVQRFTPRKPTSNWSEVNIAKVAKLRAEGRMRPAGEAAFARRREDRSGVYSFEQRNEPQLEPEQEERFRANEAAWKYFMSRPPSYRKPALWWVVSAKKPETRERRLATLIEDSAAGRPLKQLTPRKRKA